MTTRTTLAALVVVALIGVGCGSNAPSETGSKSDAPQGKAVRFAKCMRDNGVSGFPDPDASGELTIDGVLNGSSLDPNAPTWKEAMAACKELQPSGFTGDKHVTTEEQEARLAFAQCMRDNGVADFPDPAKGAPLVNTNLIPSAAQPDGMSILNAAMQKCGEAAEAAGAKG
jgi:hypothetical protein